MRSITGRRNSPFGTGRVMSQTRMHALRRPRATSASDTPDVPASRALRTAASASSTGGTARLPTTVSSAVSGTCTGSVERS